MEHKWGMSGEFFLFYGEFLKIKTFYIAIFKNKNKRIFVPYGFQQVFNIQIYTTYKYI